MFRHISMFRGKSRGPLASAILPLLFCAAPAAAQYVSGRYILVLADPPVGARYATRESLSAAPARAYRAQVQQRQAALMAELRTRKITAVGAVSTLLNAVFVTATPDRLNELKALPGVIAVLPERRQRPLLNTATQLMKGPDAWALGAIGGQGNAGRGIKIGIIDSGIDQNHPAFQDPSLPAAGFPYPICTPGHPEDCAYTNNKVIVARSYVRQVAGFQYSAANTNTITGPPDPTTSQPDDYSPRDRMGHGTAVASAAAANQTNNGTVPISGMAPKAYLGNYKIAGSPGVNDFPPEDVFIQAVEDALNDGMDVVNMSWGGTGLTGPLDTGDACGLPAGVACDQEAYAFENAAQHGLVVVAAAGNSGKNWPAYNPYPAFNSISSPGSAPSVIAVGATINSHTFGPAVSVAGPGAPSNLQKLKSTPSDSFVPGYYGALIAPLADVSQIGDGYACSSFPAGWLSGKFALVLRGPTAKDCDTGTKGTNVQAAGATGMILYNTTDAAAFPDSTVEGVQDFSGPVAGLANADGVALKNYVDANPSAMVSIDLAGAERPPDARANQLASFSSFGPGPGAFPSCATCSPMLLKPDLLATGGGDPNLFPVPSDMYYVYGYPGLYLATQSYDPMGYLYGANGYTASNGTSFASPLVAGAAALVLQAHPEWKTLPGRAALVKSALVNWSNPSAVTSDDYAGTSNPSIAILDVRNTGAGLLDAAASVQATVTAAPATVSFGALKPGGSLPAAQAVTITNLSPTAVALSVAVFPQTGRSSSVATVTVDKQTLSLEAAGSSTATATLNVSLAGAVPSAAGAYSGNINLTATASGIAMHIPYLFVVGSGSFGTDGNIVPMCLSLYCLSDGTSLEGPASQDLGVVAVQVLDGNGVPVAGAPVVFSRRSGATVTMQSGAQGIPACTPANSTSLVTCTTDNYGFAYVDLQAGQTPGSTTITYEVSGVSSNRVMPFQATIRLVPSTAGVSDSAKGLTPIAPGSYVSIYGTNLSDTRDVATTAILPLALDAVTVSFDVPSQNISVPGHIVFVSPGQVNVQAPWELQGLPAGTQAQVKVTINETDYGTLKSVPVADVSPTFFETGANNVAALVANTSTVINSSRPAKTGEYIELYANGLGPVDNPPASGEPAPASPLSHTKNGCTVSIGGQTQAALFCGLAPGMPGLYQINVQIPPGVGSGSQALALTVAGKTATSSIPLQ
ncbi:MAG: S8 family serine peptidase [Acidobacteriia bacterium]|nr:S8 family serine peptidase [Terriglobia bacterium]